MVIIVLFAIYLIGFRGSLFGWTPFVNSYSENSIIYQNNDTESSQIKKGDNSPKTTDKIPVSENLKASIVTLNQSNGYITFSGTTNDTKTVGKCSIEFTTINDRPVTRYIDANPATDGATCGPVKIPETEFAYLGNWTVTFRYYSNNIQAVTEGSITIK